MAECRRTSRRSRLHTGPASTRDSHYARIQSQDAHTTARRTLEAVPLEVTVKGHHNFRSKTHCVSVLLLRRRWRLSIFSSRANTPDRSKTPLPVSRRRRRRSGSAARWYHERD